jgi:hypothetical protein
MSDQTTEQAVQNPAPEQVSLQLTDILAAAQCIQLASTRGAFRAEEFTQVGGTYERLVSFLQASGALNTPTGEQPADEKPAA